jgi:molecular chaperone DnaJ
MIKRDYYEVLGLAKDSDDGSIKKAYRKMALQYHPDKNPGDHSAEDRFKEASEAYEVLSDPDRRRIYDAYGHAGLEGRGYHGFEGGVEDIFSSFGDIFGDLFGMGFGAGHGRGGRRARGGSDLREDITITFEESAHGVEKDIMATRHASCEECKGSGDAPGSTRETCSACGGHGQVAHRQGFFMIQTTCPRCHGAGSKSSKHCDHCRGQGRVRNTRKLHVKIPAGVADGMRLILRGEGEAGEHGGPSGDLYVFIAVKPHARLRREENNIIDHAEISFPQTALGHIITVHTLFGDEKLEIPAGTTHGTRLRIPKKGFPSLQGRGHGDHVVEIHIQVQKKLSKRAKELLKELGTELH